MVTQKILRTHEGKWVLLYKKRFVTDPGSNQMPSTDQITDIASYMRTYL